MKPDVAAIVERFPQRVPVFPLPNAVLFPGAVLPLHVFEPRYRTMLDDVLEADRLLALALLQPCGPEEYEARPPFHELVSVGYVLQREPLPDGRSNIALFGVSAGRAGEPEDDRPYRTAVVELLPDVLDVEPGYEERLVQALERSVHGSGDAEALRARLGALLSDPSLPAALIGACAQAAPLLPRDKLGLLEERSLARRLERLVAHLERPWQWN